MVSSTIYDAIAIVGSDGGVLLVATAAADGTPHVATGDELAVGDDGRITVSGWFCRQTVSNLGATRRLAVLALDARGSGYQIVGRTREVEELVMLDGWSSELPDRPRVPQVRRRISLDVDEVLGFVPGAHVDRPADPFA